MNVHDGGEHRGVLRCADEGVLDPWVAEWLESQFGRVDVDLPTMAREGRAPRFPPAPNLELGDVSDDSFAGVPVRVYQPIESPVGLVVYCHGGGFCSGSVQAMDGFARQLTHHAGAVVVSVEYRLSPQHPYPAALDDCAAVTEWALSADRAAFDLPAGCIAVAGESAGGNLAAAVVLRLRDAAVGRLAAQALLYPSVEPPGVSRRSELQFGNLVVGREGARRSWEWYAGGRDLGDDPYAVPLSAPDLAGVPPALVLLGGCDPLRDGGRAYAARLREAGADVSETCYAGQPHGFMNFNFPAAAGAFAETGAWLRASFARAAGG